MPETGSTHNHRQRDRFPKKKRAILHGEVRDILHEFYIEISTTRMSKEVFDGFVDRIIDTVRDKKA